MNALLNLPQPTTTNSWPSAVEDDSSDSDSDNSMSSSSSDELSTTASQNVQSADAVAKTESAVDVPLIHCKDALGQPMIFFRNKESEIIGIFRCLLYTKLNMPNTVDEMLQRVSNLRQSRYWAILLYSGGKFSAGIFDEDKELIHKTFHRYTVRAKQGGSQAARDSASGGMGGQKSAGSSLRRYGEQAIRSDIAHLLHVKWRPYLQACQLILTWTPKVHRGIFFTPPTSSEAPIREEDTEDREGSDEGRPGGAGSNPLPPPPPPDHLAADAVAARVGVVHNDLRLRRLPCRAKNITYAHVKELQREFSSFRVFDSLADYDLIRQSERKQLEQMANGEGQTVYESKSGRLFFGNIPLVQKESTLRTADVSESSEETTSEEGGHDLDEHNRSTPESGSPAQQKVSEVTEPSPLSSPQLATPKRKSRRKAASSRKLAAVRDLSSESEESVVAASPETSKAADLARLCTTYSVWHRSIRMAIAVGDMERLKALLPEAGCVQLAENRADRRDSKPGNSETNGEHPLIPPPSTNQTNRKSGFWAMRANLEAARNSASASAPASLDPSMPIPSSEDATQLLNYRLSDGRSLLHLAVELQGDPDVIHMLLSLGCRPDCPDVHGMTPYRLAGQLGKSKFSACFRKFRKAYPDRYDYEKAQIPCGPDPPPATSTKYSPSQRSRPKRTQAEVTNASSVLTQSAADRKPVEELKFAGLSMREKCALAAERRIAAAQGAAAAASTVSANPVGYCCQCSTDLTGRQPFTYNDFRFCSPSCLRTHRLGANR
ncbi:hypothetical protein AAHC03_024344 [Spirometra sp. Aus1]